jgi:hypothetical protein
MPSASSTSESYGTHDSAARTKLLVGDFYREKAGEGNAVYLKTGDYCGAEGAVG